MVAGNFLGTGWRFPPQFFRRGKELSMASNEDDIRESLEILLSTMVGERLYHPDFGCDLKKFMFEEINNALVTEVQEMIATAIYTYEPRVEILEITVTESEETAYVSRELIINIKYLINATNNEENMVYPLSLY